MNSMKNRIALPTPRVIARWSVQTVGCVGLLLAVACGAEAGAGVAASSVTTASLAATASYVANANQTSASDANRAMDDNQSLGVEHILPLLHLLPPEAAMGMHCDPNAAPAPVTVCGDTVPGNAQRTWTDCQMRGGPGHHAPHDGTPPVSSGNVTITAAITPDANTTCDANTIITAQRQAQFNVRVVDANGPAWVVAGTNAEAMSHTVTHMSQSGNITLDVNRTVLDANGQVVSVTRIAGAVQFVADANAANVADANAPMPPMDMDDHPGARDHHPPMMMAPRLMSGTLTVNQDTVVLTGVVHGFGCMWPTSGSIERTDAQGTGHTLIFGSPCGSATLDGNAVTLPSKHPHHAAP